MVFWVYYVSDTVLNALSHLSNYFLLFHFTNEKHMQLIESYVHLDVPMQLNLTIQKISVGKEYFLTQFYSTLLKYNFQKVENLTLCKYKKK